MIPRSLHVSTLLLTGLLMALLTAVHSSPCWASSTGPFGTGLPDGGVPGATLFPRLAGLFISSQIYFNEHLTAAILAIHHGDGAWALLALSFLYGVVHAIGPGHGKAVVSSYLLATRQTLRNGILLAFVSSLAQALGAILLIFVASTILHMTSVSLTQATAQFEVVSGLLVLLLGCWLVWSKIIRPLLPTKIAFETVPPLVAAQRQFVLNDPPMRFQASAVMETDATALPVAGDARPAQATAMSPRWPDRHVPLGGDQCSCGHVHMPDANVAGGKMDWRKAWTVLASTAFRPCTGALIVLVFSISQRLWGMGVLSTLLMGLGTAITVSVIAILAVFAHKSAFVLTSADSRLGRKIIRGIEVCGAIVVLAVGGLLVAGVF
jgi:nickel/cobalt transporter (NicO) family protein